MTRPSVRRRGRSGAAALVLTVAGLQLAACADDTTPAASPSPGVVRPASTTTTAVRSTTTLPGGATTTSPPVDGPPRRVGASAAPPTSRVPTTPTPSSTTVAPSAAGDWEITVYVTAVERYYHGTLRPVRGCPTVDCDSRTPKVDLGSYPGDFVDRVRDEGTGLISNGPNAGRYLNWSSDTGYWLDTMPRDSFGHRLVPYVSAAADGVPAGTRVRITSCGRNDDGSAPDPQVCAALTSARWQVLDEFTPGLGGVHHIDLYLGEEDRADYTATSPYWVTFVGATVTW